MKKTLGTIADNRKVRFHYHVEETLECGIELQGTEIKAIRQHHISFGSSFVQIKNHELWLQNLRISPYDFGNIHNHFPERSRRLLAHQRQIRQLQRQVKEKGYTLMPLRFYFKGALCKLEIGVCRGKKLYDKRQTIKERDLEREEQRRFSS